MSYCFKPGQKFVWRGVDFAVTHIKKGLVRIEILSSSKQKDGKQKNRVGERENVTLIELSRAWSEGELQFAADERLARPGPDGVIVVENKYPSWEDVPKDKRKKAEWRLNVIAPLLVPNRTRLMVANRANDAELREEAEKYGYSLYTSGIYDWIRWYGPTRDLRVLVDDSDGKQGGPGKKRFDPLVLNIFTEVVDEQFLIPEGCSRLDVADEVEKRIKEENKDRKPDKQLKIPKYITVTRWIKELDPVVVQMARLGEEAAERLFRQYGQMQYPTEPMVRVELDFTTMDLIVLDENGIPMGRLSVILGIDTATRYPWGYSTSFLRGYQAVMECFRHGIRPKNTREQYNTIHEWLAYGTPLEVVPDRALEFVKSEAFREACLALGITLMPTEARSPWEKPTIERFIKTKHEGKIHKLPGTTFSDILERGDYDSEENACIFVDQIDEILNLYFVDEYAQTRHRGIRDTPAHRWEMMTREHFSPNLPGTAEELDIILRPFEMRTLEHYGVEIEYLKYNDIDNPEVGVLRYRMDEKKRERRDKKQTEEEPGRLKVKYDPNNLEYVYIFDPFQKPAGRYIKLPSTNPDYTRGLTLYQHMAILNYTKAHEPEVNKESLWRSRERISEIILEGIDRRDQLRTHTKTARLVTGGKPTRNQEPSVFTHPTSRQSEAENIPPAPAEEQGEPLFIRKPRPQNNISDAASQNPTT